MSNPTRPPTLPWTGERCVPDAMGVDHITVREHIARYRWATERLMALPANRVVLDAPCGAGYGTALLAGSPNTAITMGIDIDPPTVDYARRRYGAPGRILFAVEDLVSVRTRADVVVCFEGIEHVADQSAAAQALCCATKPGGLLMLSTPRADGPGAGSIYHTRELLLDELIALFEPHLDRIQVWGQNLDVGDAQARDAVYLILEGVKPL